MADTYSYKSGFRVFAENSTTNVTSDYNGIYRNDTTWENYDARKSGLLPGDFISSITLNTALRQATFMSTLLGEALADSGITGQTIDTSSVSNLTSWVAPVSRAIAYGYNLSTNNIKIGGNFDGTFTAQFGPDIRNATGDVIPVPESCYRFTGYQNLAAHTLMSVIPTNDSSLIFRENDPTDARGDLYAATLHAQYGTLRLHVGMTYDNSANLLAVDERIVTMQELRQTSWLSAGVKIQRDTNLNTLTTVGNYYYPLDATHIVNVPLGTYGPFTLKVSSVPDGSNFLIQQQFTQCNNGNTYTRVRNTDGIWESIGSALGNYGSGWSVAYNTITAAIIDFTRAEAINSGCKESEDGTHKIIVPVKALIQCAVNHYSTRACLRVGGVGATLDTNPSYFGIQIEGLPVMDDFLVHIDIKSYNSDAWITLEQTNKTYQCFYNSNYYAKTINGQPNPLYDARPKWIYVPSSGYRDTAVKYKEDADGNKTYTDIVDGKPVNTDTMPIPTGTIGSASQPMYLDGGRLIASNATVGGANQPIWMDNGVLKNCSGKVGDTNKPIYMNNGVLTACKYAYTVIDALPSEAQADTIYFITED